TPASPRPASRSPRTSSTWAPTTPTPAPRPARRVHPALPDEPVRPPDAHRVLRAGPGPRLLPPGTGPGAPAGRRLRLRGLPPRALELRRGHHGVRLPRRVCRGAGAPVRRLRRAPGLGPAPGEPAHHRAPDRLRHQRLVHPGRGRDARLAP